MKEFINTISKDKTIFIGFSLAGFLILLTLALTAIAYRFLPPYLPLYNQMPWGHERLGTTEQLFLPIVISSTVFFTNILIAYLLYKKLPLTSRILCVTSLLLCFFTLLFILRTILIII